LFISHTIKDILKSIIVNSGQNHALMFLGSLHTIFNRWFFKEGLNIGYDDCINIVGSITIPNIDTNNKDVSIVFNNVN